MSTITIDPRTNDLTANQVASIVSEILNTPEFPLNDIPVEVPEQVETVTPFAQAVQDLSAGANASQAIPIVLFEDYAEIELPDGSKKQVSHISLKEMLSRSLAVEEPDTEITGMLLPSNVFFLSQSKKSIKFNTYYPGGVRNMIYNDRKLDIVAPNIILSISLRKDRDDWIVENVFYFCTDLPLSKLPKTFIDKLAPSKGIYVLPMSNTYDAGNMCYGSNTMPARFKDNNFRGLDWYFRFLWETPFNNDLGIRAVPNVTVGGWYGLLEKLAKAGKGFPYRDLRNWTQIEGAVASTSEVGSIR